MRLLRRRDRPAGGRSLLASLAMLGKGAVIAIAVMTVAAAARADGTVYRAEGCGDHIFVSTTDGFSVLLGSGVTGVKDGDTLHGDVERIGTPLLFDTTSGHSVFAEVAERDLTRAEVTRQIAVHCRAASGEVIVRGYVTRATGCGQKIFVSTPKGYAVLERMAGGVVAEGDTLVGPLDRPGRATVEDRQSGNTLVVFVQDLWLSKSAASRKVQASCRR